MLDLHSIYKTFNAGTVNEKTALNGLNLHLNEGDFVTVIGGNGAGKSTMLNAVAGTWFVDEEKSPSMISTGQSSRSTSARSISDVYSRIR